MDSHRPPNQHRPSTAVRYDSMDATTTLADALLGDLDDLSDLEESNDTQEEENEAKETTSASGNGKQENWSPGSSTTIARRRFLDDANLQAHLEALRKSDSSKTASAEARKRQEEEEHQLILQSNKYLSNLANELARAHGDLCAAYKAKFPELEELIMDPIKYKSAVRVIGNAMDLTTVNEGLNEFLSSNQIITISVAGSTTSGRPLSADELVAVDEAATYMEDLAEVQQELTRFVESRMESLAPSVCALVGPSTAAVLLGLAGGLAELSKIPACNLQVLGQVKQNAASRAGMSSSASKPHTGILAECELVKSCPSYLQRKALKVVAAKLALAARCDFINVDTGRPRSAASGMRFRHEVETKIASWQTPDKAPVLKALPKPDLTVKKRRGGKRMRRLKERYEETEMMKQANTRAFSLQSGEYGDDSMGLTMGMLDTTEGGALRKTTEKRKMRQANTKASRKRAIQMAATASKDGLASSMVFTPVQGMELVNPEASKERVREANRKWFSEDAGFTSALPKK